MGRRVITSNDALVAPGATRQSRSSSRRLLMLQLLDCQRRRCNNRSSSRTRTRSSSCRSCRSRRTGRLHPARQQRGQQVKLTRHLL